MQNQLRGRARNDRLALHDEDEKANSPSYFEWCERTVRTKAYQPKPPQRFNSIVRLLRRIARQN